MFFKDTTVAFTGHNIKWFAKLAIESFLFYYPKMRDHIVYFDDDSTDGTKEELEKSGIKVITWTKKNKDTFLDMINKNIIKEGLPILPIRVSFIMKDLFEQINTKYVFVSDGDVVFKEGNFLEKYFKDLEEGYKIVTTKGHCFFDEEVKERIINDKDVGDFYKKFILKTKMKHLRNYSIPEEEKRLSLLEYPYCTERVQFLQTLMDLEYFKSIDIVGDTLIPEVLEVYDGCILDTGTDFYCRIVDKDVPIKWIDYNYLIKHIYHWCWLSSANRDTSKFLDKDYRNFIGEMERVLFDEGLGEIAKIIGITPMKLINSFSETRGKSNLV